MPAAEVLGGLTLAQYAAVKAAVAEPFPLEDVLAIEEIDAGAWDEAGLAWTARLCEDPALFSRYAGELGAAEDRLARKISPLEDDAGAWVAFLASFSAAPEAGGWLAEHGLGMNDLARLRRRWALRARIDPDVDKRIARLAKRGAAALPRLTVAPSKLVRSSGARTPQKPAPEPDAPAQEIAEPAMPFETWAALCGEIDAATSTEDAVLAKHGISRKQRDSIAASFRARFAKDPQAERDFMLLRAHHRARLFKRAPAPAPQKWVEPGTAVLDAAQIVDLPFRVTPSATFLDAMDRAPVAAPGAGSDGQTLIALSPFAAITPGAAPRSDDEEATRIVPAPKLEEPPMALERHASICVELAVPGAPADDVLARYRVTPEEKARADQHWKTRLAADPAQRAAWNEAFEVYRAWFRGG